jgi:hypothetical protein
VNYCPGFVMNFDHVAVDFRAGLEPLSDYFSGALISFRFHGL